MNTELLEKVRDRIAAGAGFDMGTFACRTECGTTLCIAGHASVLSGATLDFVDYDSNWVFRRGDEDVDPSDDASDQIGLTGREAAVLFYAWAWPAEYRTDLVHTTPELAVALLDAVIARGEIWWAK